MPLPLPGRGFAVDVIRAVEYNVETLINKWLRWIEEEVIG